MNSRVSSVEHSSTRRVRREERGEQYSLAKILGIRALAAVPLGVLSWIAFPLLAPDFGANRNLRGVHRVGR